MSAIGILRSFAEARCADHEPIPARLTYGTIREVLRIIEEWERSARKPTNETTPDAVEMLDAVLRRNPTCNARALSVNELHEFRSTLLAERARHAEEVARLEAAHLSDLETIEAWKLASGLECGGDPDGVTPAGMRRYWEGVEADRDSLRDQLRKVEGERDAERKHATEMEERALDLVRDLRLAQTELHALRALLPDVRACARFTYRAAAEGQLVPEFSSAQKLLAADFLREPCPECHMVERCKMSCSRGGSKGGRFSVSLDSQGGEGE